MSLSDLDPVYLHYGNNGIVVDYNTWVNTPMSGRSQKTTKKITGEKMREILFRGQKKDTKEWVYGFYCKDKDAYRGSVEESCIGLWDEKERCTAWHVVIPETVGQYINKDDKAGEKLFGGDIVKYKTLKGELIGVISFEDSAFGIKGDASFDYLDNESNLGDIEKIGTIHENPELLEAK